MNILPKALDYKSELFEKACRINPMFETIGIENVEFYSPKYELHEVDGVQYNSKVTVWPKANQSKHIGLVAVSYNRHRFQLMSNIKCNVYVSPDEKINRREIALQVFEQCNIDSSVADRVRDSELTIPMGTSVNVSLTLYDGHLFFLPTGNDTGQPALVTAHANGINITERLPTTIIRPVFANSQDGSSGGLLRLSPVRPRMAYQSPDIRRADRYIPFALFGYDMTDIFGMLAGVQLRSRKILEPHELDMLNALNRKQNIDMNYTLMSFYNISMFSSKESATDGVTVSDNLPYVSSGGNNQHTTVLSSRYIQCMFEGNDDNLAGDIWTHLPGYGVYRPGWNSIVYFGIPGTLYAQGGGRFYIFTSKDIHGVVE